MRILLGIVTKAASVLALREHRQTEAALARKYCAFAGMCQQKTKVSSRAVSLTHSGSVWARSWGRFAADHAILRRLRFHGQKNKLGTSANLGTSGYFQSMAAHSQALAPKKRLDSWKEIAAFFGRDERTVKRWEKERGLPVYRVPGSARGGVFAYAEELAEWLKAPNVVWEATAAAADNPPPDEKWLPRDRGHFAHQQDRRRYPTHPSCHCRSRI